MAWDSALLKIQFIILSLEVTQQKPGAQPSAPQTERLCSAAAPVHNSSPLANLFIRGSKEKWIQYEIFFFFFCHACFGKINWVMRYCDASGKNYDLLWALMTDPLLSWPLQAKGWNLICDRPNLRALEAIRGLKALNVFSSLAASE